MLHARHRVHAWPVTGTSRPAGQPLSELAKLRLQFVTEQTELLDIMALQQSQFFAYPASCRDFHDRLQREPKEPAELSI